LKPGFPLHRSRFETRRFQKLWVKGDSQLPPPPPRRAARSPRRTARRRGSPNRVSDWSHGPYRLSSTGGGGLVVTPVPGVRIGYVDHSLLAGINWRFGRHSSPGVPELVTWTILAVINCRFGCRSNPGLLELVTRTILPPTGVDGRVERQPLQLHVVAAHVAFERQTFKPGYTLDRKSLETRRFQAHGSTGFNLYRPPTTLTPRYTAPVDRGGAAHVMFRSKHQLMTASMVLVTNRYLTHHTPERE
jgi:hypothetical protein